MGRAPCCDKANVKKGPWSPEEDATLKSYIEENGTGGNWIALPQKIGKHPNFDHHFCFSVLSFNPYLLLLKQKLTLISYIFVDLIRA